MQLKCLRMVIGFCNIRRSIVCMVLMAALSNTRLRLIPNSSSFLSVDTDCPVERLESRLASIEAQLNRRESIVSTCCNHLIKENCTVNLASYGLDDSPRNGYVRTSGGTSEDVLLPGNPYRNRGVVLFELDATKCMTRNRQRFDTFWNPDDRVQFLEILESATTGTIMVGVTADSAEYVREFRNSAGSFFTRYNMNISVLGYRDKAAFIMQKGYPKKSVFERKPRYGESLLIKIVLRGSTTYDVTFSRM